MSELNETHAGLPPLDTVFSDIKDTPERIVALIEFRDGTVIDTVRQLRVPQQ